MQGDTTEYNFVTYFAFSYLMNSIYSLMTLNRIKLGRAVTFTKYLASIISLIFLAKTLFWNIATFPASNSLNLAELVVNEPMKSIDKKIYQYSFFCLIYHCLM